MQALHAPQAVTLGSLLQKARQAQGLSVSALAALAGIHRSTISRWERGLAQPFAHELTQALNALALSPAERRACYKCLDAPRAIQFAAADPGAVNSPVSSSELLRALRIRSGHTQDEAARAAEVSRSLVARWERGDCWPSSQHLHRLCFLYGTTEDETVLLTTRAWRSLEPLPQDKDALDALVQYLEHHDASTTRSGTYLALAGRYRALYDAGKISETDANAVYGCYGYYLSWRLDQLEAGGKIAGSALATLRRTRGTLSYGQREAVSAFIYLRCHQGQVQEAADLLSELSGRVSANAKSQWLDMHAHTAEAGGDLDGASAYYEKSLAAEQSDLTRSVRQVRFVQMLCRHKRYAQALPHLMPLDPNETRRVFGAANLLNHAWVAAGVGEVGAAQAYQAQADRVIAAHGFDTLAHESVKLTQQLEAGTDHSRAARVRATEKN